MSRLGKKPIELPKNVQAQLQGSVLNVKGPKGTLTMDVPQGIVVEIETSQIVVSSDPSLTSAFHGLYRALVKNLVVGVSSGFEKKLSLIGVGYRASVQGKDLDLQLGYSHPTKLPIPTGIQVAVDKTTTIIITGADKQAVGQFAAEVRSIRPPEPYKGKGVRYENEYVRKKAGKAAKSKAG